MKKNLLLLASCLLFAACASTPSGPEGSAEFQKRMALAKQGDAAAQLYVGNRYDKGTEGVRMNKDEGLKWILASANQGNALAQSVAGMRLKSRGDNIEAYKWLYLAREGGNENARTNIIGVEKLLKPEELAEAKKRAAEFQPKLVIPE